MDSNCQLAVLGTRKRAKATSFQLFQSKGNKTHRVQREEPLHQHRHQRKSSKCIDHTVTGYANITPRSNQMHTNGDKKSE